MMGDHKSLTLGWFMMLSIYFIFGLIIRNYLGAHKQINYLTPDH